MKHKILVAVLLLLQAACGVEVKNRNQKTPEPVSELKVEKEYSLPIPNLASEQLVLRYDRLVLGRDSQFITQGLNVRIEVKELISDGGTIRTFKEDQIASPGNNGRSGGHLELVIGHATGELNLVMQGEKGGTGADGKGPDQALKGPTGAPGMAALFVDLRPGIRVQGHKATNGAQGGMGLRGYPGDPGLKGGDSGTALIKISDEEDFKLLAQKHPGHGGDGGQGGVGGPGGDGGPPGKESIPEYHGPETHNYTTQGPQGPQGPQGLQGNPGSDGYEEKICSQTGAQELHCE